MKMDCWIAVQPTPQTAGAGQIDQMVGQWALCLSGHGECSPQRRKKTHRAAQGSDGGIGDQTHDPAAEDVAGFFPLCHISGIDQRRVPASD